MKKISAIILAAGQGKRMRSDIPKALHSVSGLPMLLLVLEILKQAGIRSIVVVVGSGADLVRKILPQDVQIVDQGKPLGTGHALQCTEKIFRGYNDSLLIVCADMPLVKKATIQKFINSHQKNRSSCTIMTALVDNPFGYGRIVRDNSGNVRQIAEDTDSSTEIKKIKEVNSGMYCFQASDLFTVLKRIDKKNRQKEFYLTDTIQLLIRKDFPVRVFRVGDPLEILGINSRKDLAFAQKIMNQRILQQHMEKGVTIVDSDSTYIDIRAKIGKDTVIKPFTVIDGNVVIGRHCEVGPFTHLRGQTVLKDRAEIGNFVEVKKSLVGKNTKAKHLTYLGDTIIGQKVNIGAGTITANYDGKNKYTTQIKDRAFIGTHTTLVAPVTVGTGAITGAGAVVLRNRNIPANTIVVGMPARVLRKKD